MAESESNGIVGREAATRRMLQSSSALRQATIAGRAKSLVANRAIKEGEVVLLEAPVCHVMLPGHSKLQHLCVVCGASLETSIQQSYERFTGSCLDGLKILNKRCLSCTSNSDVATNGDIWESAAGLAFHEFANNTNRTMLLASRLAVYKRSHPSIDWLSEYQSDAYETVCHINEGMSNADIAKFRKEVKSNLEQGRQLLLKVFVGSEDSETLKGDSSSSFLTLAVWSRLCGLCHQNAASVSLPSCIRDTLESAVEEAVGGQAFTFQTKMDESAGTDAEDVVRRLLQSTRKWCETHGEGFEEEEEVEDGEEDDEGEVEEESEEEEDSAGEDGEGEGEEQEEGKDEDEGNSEEVDSLSPQYQMSKDDPQAELASTLVSVYNNLPPTEASGLFHVLCLMNHSCDPNCRYIRIWFCSWLNRAISL